MHQEGKERDEEQEVVPLQILEGEEGRSQQCLVEEDQREKRRQNSIQYQVFLDKIIYGFL